MSLQEEPYYFGVYIRVPDLFEFPHGQLLWELEVLVVDSWHV